MPLNRMNKDPGDQTMSLSDPPEAEAIFTAAGSGVLAQKLFSPQNVTYGTNKKRDTLGNFMYNTSYRVDPYRENDSYQFKLPQTPEAYKEAIENLNKMQKIISEKFTERTYDLSTRELQSSTKFTRFKNKLLQQDVEYRITPVLKNEQIGRVMIPNFWSSFLISDDDSQALCWQIYEQAHEMMGAENWSLSNEKESLETLKYLAGNRFIDEIRSQVQDKTIEWRLDNWDITEEIPTVLDIHSERSISGHEFFFISLRMKSLQTLNVWDRMGRPVISDLTSREVDEIVTFCHVLPDPEWRGWRITAKQNFQDAVQLANTNVVSSVARQKEEVKAADEWTREEVHSNYNIWSGSRDWTIERQRDYYHKGWNYGGTQESESIMGEGGLEYQMKKLDVQESAHSTLGKQRIAGKGMPIKLDGKFWEKHLHRKRAQVHFGRQSGQLPKKTAPKVWLPGGRRPL